MKIKVHNYTNNTWELVDPKDIDIIGLLFFQERFFQFLEGVTEDELAEFFEYLEDSAKGLDDCDYYRYGNDILDPKPNTLYCFDDGVLDDFETHKKRAIEALKKWERREQTLVESK